MEGDGVRWYRYSCPPPYQQETAVRRDPSPDVSSRNAGQLGRSGLYLRMGRRPSISQDGRLARVMKRGAVYRTVSTLFFYRILRHTIGGSY